MKLLLPAVCLLAPLVACVSPSPDAGPAPATTLPASTPEPASLLTARVVVLTPTGERCVLDGETGAVQARSPSSAVDVVSDESQPGGLATVEPGDAPIGRLARYRLRGHRLEQTSELPFDAPDGRLLWAGSMLVGALRNEGVTLFWARAREGSGKAWSPFVSAAVLAGSDEVRVQTVSASDAQQVEVRTARVSERGVESLGSTSLSAPRAAPALFAAGDAFGRVDTTATGWRVVGGPHDGFHMEAPDEFPVEARLLDGRRLAVLTGPRARLRVLSVWGASEVTLGGERLDPPDQVGHRLAFDAGRQRVWALAGRTAYAVALPAMTVVATGGCQALALAVVMPE